MSELPPGWAEASVATVGHVITGSTPSTKESTYWGGAIPFVTPGDMNHLAVTNESERTVTDQGAARGRVLPPRSVLVTCIGNLGRTTITSRPCISNQQINAIIPFDSEMDRYIEYACCSPCFQQQLRRASTSTTVALVNKSNFEGLTVPVAPRAEQKRIVAAIEEQFSRLDAGMAALESVRKSLRRMRAAVLRAAVTGTLVPQEPDEGLAVEQLARLAVRSRFTKGMQPPTLENQALPSSWTTARVEDLAERVTVGFVGPMQSEYRPVGIPFLRSQNVRPNRFDATGMKYVSPEFHRRIIKSKLLPGDVVVVRSGSVGTACVVPDPLGEANCSDLVVVQRPTGIESRFLVYYMNSLAQQYVRAGQVGVALVHFNTKSVAALPVPLPPMAEQRRIVAEADRQLSLVSRLEDVIALMLDRSAQLRSSVLAAAFSGHLVPQDPRDEPATALLERIAAEQASSNGGRKPAQNRQPRTPRQKPRYER